MVLEAGRGGVLFFAPRIFVEDSELAALTALSELTDTTDGEWLLLRF